MKLNLALLTGILSISLFLSSCSKYEDGPAFAFSSKKARLIGEWHLKEVNGKEDINKQYWTFDKSSEFSVRYGSVANVNPAIWNFDDKKENIEIYYINSDTYEYYLITRLSSKELWVEIALGSTITQIKFDKSE